MFAGPTSHVPQVTEKFSHLPASPAASVAQVDSMIRPVRVKIGELFNHDYVFAKGDSRVVSSMKVTCP